MAETAYYNGIVYTADETQPAAEAFIVKDGRFLLVGNNEEVSICDNRVDLKGKCVIPGLVDSHCHMFAGIIQAEMQVMNFNGPVRPDQLSDQLLKLLHDSPDPDRDTVAAMGIRLEDGPYCAQDIDCAISDRPVVVFSDDCHALLLNSKAMEMLGIDRNTENPDENSYFVRDGEGNPTGLVIELAAMRRCSPLMENGSDSSGKDAGEILSALAHSYAALGYTTIFEAMSMDKEKDISTFEALKKLYEDGSLPLRICTCFGYHGEDFLPAREAVGIMKRVREEFSSDLIHPDTLKMFMDGTVEEHTALLFEPYSDEPDNYGIRQTGLEEMKDAAVLAAQEGFSIHIHAIGDKAVSNAIDLFTSLGEIPGTKTIAHNQLYRKEDIDRVAGAGDIFIQTTPQWFGTDDYTLNCLGEERCRRQFPIGSLMKKGVVVAFGSDSCLEEESADAFLGMYDALTKGNGITDRWECLKAYTINGARQLKVDNETGSISPGKSADFIILDRDIMQCSLEELKETEVVETFFGGEFIEYKR